MMVALPAIMMLISAIIYKTTYRLHNGFKPELIDTEIENNVELDAVKI